MNRQKSAYICGPLTEIREDFFIWFWIKWVLSWIFGRKLRITRRKKAKMFYEKLADLCGQVLGIRSFVPHKHYDPVNNPDPRPEEVFAAEREQVCLRTSVLVVTASFGPSWGGGIEVAWANEIGIPIILLYPCGMRVSRLLRGAVEKSANSYSDIISYKSENEALYILRIILLNLSPTGNSVVELTNTLRKYVARGDNEK